MATGVVLIVDDDEGVRQLLTVALTEAGFRAESVGTGVEALNAALELAPAVIVLDVVLPDLTGIDVCFRLRTNQKLFDVGVLMLSARGEEADRLLGFENGADDYVVKPFSVRELVVRVRGLSVRAHERRLARIAMSDGPRLRWRGIALDPLRHRVTLDSNEVTLRPLEYKLLAAFIQAPERTFTREELLQEIWGIRTKTSRTVDTHIRRLRERLGVYSDVIETVHGFGYRLREE